MYGDEEIVELLKEIIRRLERVEQTLANQQKVPFTTGPVEARPDEVFYR
jgi:hypothetical protein